MLPEVAWASLKGLFALSVLLAVGKWLLPMVFHEVARARSDELFVLCTLLVALLAASLTQWMGLSHGPRGLPGGHDAGESHYRHQLGVDIKPFPGRADGALLHHHRHDHGLDPGGGERLVAGAAVRARASSCASRCWCCWRAG